MSFFEKPIPARSPLREKITSAYYQDESTALHYLLAELAFTEAAEQSVADIAKQLVKAVREQTNEKSGVDALMSHYDLSSEEGILLMCLAEALLRIPDKDTEELLLKDKLGGARWEKHVGESESRFVNMASWGLAFTGKMLDEKSHDTSIKKIWYGLLSRCGEPFVRQAVRRTMKAMSEHFVLGRDIKEALSRSKALAKRGYLFSYDMLGEMARTPEQAQHYFRAYENAISAIGADELCRMAKPNSRPSISVKLSALHPRYEFTHREVVVPFLVAKLKQLALQAKHQGIELTVDAEEAARLDISLDIFEAVFTDSDLGQWDGLGLAVQAYQKRSFAVIEWLIELSRAQHKKIPVRLVKGAYWDTEIKLAQVGGFDGYPVFTRKAATDVSYLACAKLLLEAQDAIYAKFATHNAYSAAAILWMTQGKNIDFEFQNLQGMGEPLHGVLVNPNQYHLKSRIYAPVGKHEDLLPYLVRRLLENGANTSFVHQIANPKIPIHSLIESPVKKVMQWQCASNPLIPLPEAIYPSGRKNSRGFDVTREDQLADLMQRTQSWETHSWCAAPTGIKSDKNTASQVVNPNNHQEVVGYVNTADETQLLNALTSAENAFMAWDRLGFDARAILLEKTAELIARDFAEYVVLLRREAGKTFFDADAEIREAIDFCRYYAVQARLQLSPQVLPGPTGESNTLYYYGRGTMVCISPGNFPLAIFTGQVVASLVAGNCVLAKPAGLTPLLAAKTVNLLHEAGVPKAVVQFMPAAGSAFGKVVLTDERVAGVLFTGSTDTAKTIQKTLANREGPIVPLIAETGGINTMVVDSSALLEQVVMDVMISAFGSAGQRCSALRAVLVQDDIADAFVDMLQGAMTTWSVGNPAFLLHDVGPVIDAHAQHELQTYIDHMHKQASCIAQMDLPLRTSQASYIAPVAFEINNLSELTKEVFGPVLHVMRYARKELDQVIKQVNAKGFGLTFGVQTRINHTVDHLQACIRTGNIYVNRNMIGAVVGVQPFGGCGLSGTGPKAGGPHYLPRLVRETTLTINTTAAGGNAQLLGMDD